MPLNILTKSGLVVRVNELSESHYQLVHDYIAKQVRQQYGKEASSLIQSLDQQRQQAEEQAEEKKQELSQVLKRRLKESYIVGSVFAMAAILAVSFWIGDKERKQVG